MHRGKLHMETERNLPEEILTEIVARLPLRSISKFKSVSKTWKSIVERPCFRRLFVSLHKNSSCSWSPLVRDKEVIGHPRCKTWDLQKSLASFIPPSFKRDPTTLLGFYYRGFSNGLVMIEGRDRIYYLGNPVLRQWVQIPRPLESYFFALLMTRVDEDGVVLSFKVVMLRHINGDYDSTVTLNFSVYSSETGIWTTKVLESRSYICDLRSVTLNGTLYFPNVQDPGALVAHDFYSESRKFRVIHYPDHSVSSDNSPGFKRVLTLSQGFLTYVRTLAEDEGTFCKVWRFNNGSGDESCQWQILWNTALPCTGSYLPLLMHPFDSDIVYLWSQLHQHLVLGNLRTKKCRILRDGSNDVVHDYFIESACVEGIKWLTGSSDWGLRVSAGLLQFELPRWMESVPCPPKVEMIETTSLLPCIAPRMRARDNH